MGSWVRIVVSSNFFLLTSSGCICTPCDMSNLDEKRPDLAEGFFCHKQPAFRLQVWTAALQICRRNIPTTERHTERARARPTEHSGRFFSALLGWTIPSFVAANEINGWPQDILLYVSGEQRVLQAEAVGGEDPGQGPHRQHGMQDRGRQIASGSDPRYVWPRKSSFQPFRAVHKGRL